VLRVPPGDDTLGALAGVVVASAVYAGVTFRVHRVLGAGSMAVAFLCERHAPEGTSLAVIKVARPTFVKEAADTALLTIRKEAVALGRLNEAVPPTPFVVRFVENGELAVEVGRETLTLPWLAMEYVHGSTLEDRVEESIRETGAAFDPDRAALCVDSIATGLDAVHSVNVLHRDIKPNNILCCGVFPDEVFKLSDFGVARPVGLRQTFMQGSMGTPGYASPEQVAMEEAKIGPASDVFSLAATMYSVLTGQELFSGKTVIEVLEKSYQRRRRSIRESPHLCRELQNRPRACAMLDDAIAHGTAPDSRDRPQSAATFASAVTAALRVESVRVAAPISLRRSVPRLPQGSARGWSFRVRQAARSDLAIRNVAWDGSGTCLAVATSGLVFWNGTDWHRVALDPQHEQCLRFVQRVGPGLWLIGGARGFLAYYAANDGVQTLRRPPEEVVLELASGTPDDLAAAFASRPGGPPVLYGVTHRRWLKPLPLGDVSFVLGLERLDEERWLVAGRRGNGSGYVAIYAPLRWEVQALPVPPVRVFTSCAAAPEIGVGIAVGASGVIIRVDPRGVAPTTVPGSPDLSSAVLELNQRAWVAGRGRLWMQDPRAPGRWTELWHDPSWQVPIISLFADGRRVIGVAADGGIVEGSES
jgi:eukaryotic-like serine/threonine-protein kinase